MFSLTLGSNCNLQVLAVVDSIIEKDLSHFEKRRTSQKTVASCLMLCTDPYNLVKT